MTCHTASGHLDDAMRMQADFNKPVMSLMDSSNAVFKVCAWLVGIRNKNLQQRLGKRKDYTCFKKLLSH